MPDQWFYTTDGQQCGPVSAAELKQQATLGKLSGEDLVWKDGMPQWLPARTVKGLLPDKGAAPAGKAPGNSGVKGKPAAEPELVEAPEDDRPRPRRRQPERASAGLSGGAKVAIILGIAGAVVGIAAIVFLVIFLNNTGTAKDTVNKDGVKDAVKDGVKDGVKKDGKVVKPPADVLPKTVALQPGDRKDYFLDFTAGTQFHVWALGEQNTDVDLFVYDETGAQVNADTRVSKDAKVSVVVSKTQRYRVEVVNLGGALGGGKGNNGPNTVHLGLNTGPWAGGATSGSKYWDFDFNTSQQPNGKQTYTVEFRAGLPARFWIDGSDADATNVEIRVYDNATNQLVAESTQGMSWHRLVTWTPPPGANRVYRLEVWNRDFQRMNFVRMGYH